MDKYNNIVTKNSLFYDVDDFELETDIVQGYFEEDLNQTIVVYQVDRLKTNTNSTYKETKKNIIRFKTPIEIPCMYEIKDPELKTYDKVTSNGAYQIIGNLKAYILIKSFEKYQCDIKRGDYVSVLIDNNKLQYFCVFDDGKVNYANNGIVGAYRPGYRIIEASPATDEEFKGI